MTRPNPRRLLLIGIVALVIAGAMAAKGIVQKITANGDNRHMMAITIKDQERFRARAVAAI